MQIKTFNTTQGKEVLSQPATYLDWQSLTRDQQEKYLTEATQSGSGAYTHIIFNTVQEIRTISSNADLMNDQVNKYSPDVFITQDYHLETAAFTTHPDKKGSPVDVVRIFALPNNEKQAGPIILGTVTTTQFRNKFLQLFPLKS